jgi:hypothetical protein
MVFSVTTIGITQGYNFLPINFICYEKLLKRLYGRYTHKWLYITYVLMNKISIV